MSTHVLVGVDGSEQSQVALEHALEAFPDAQLTVLTAVDPVDAGYTPDPGPGTLTDPPGWSDREPREPSDTDDTGETAFEISGRSDLLLALFHLGTSYHT